MKDMAPTTFHILYINSKQYVQANWKTYHMYVNMTFEISKRESERL